MINQRSDLDNLEMAGLILQTQSWPDREYRFRHTLVQDAAYSSLLLEERKRIHLVTAESLEAIYSDRLEELAPILGRHFAEAGDADRACHYFVKAADHAVALHAHQEAESHYKMAIDLAYRLGKSSEILVELYVARGRMMEHAGRFAEALELYQKLETMALDSGNRSMEGVAVTRQVFCYVEPTSVHDLDRAEPLI